MNQTMQETRLDKQPAFTADKIAVDNSRIALIYQTFPTHLFTAISVSFLMVYVMWPNNSKVLLLSWMCAVILTSIIRLWHGQIFKTKAAQTKDSLKPWAWLAMLHIASSGIMWGAVPLLFLDLNTSTLSQIIIAYFFSTFIMVGQSVTYCSYRPMWFAYAIPASTLMIGQLILAAHPDSNLWAMAIILTMIFCFISLQKNSRSIVEAIQLKLQYSELMSQLQEQKNKADEANHGKSIFLASTSHDLRQPVHAMNLFIEVLQKKQMPTQAKELVDKISKCARSLQSLFNSLLDISNLDAGTIEYYPRSVNVKSLIDSMVSIHKPEAEENHLGLESDCDEIYVDTDPTILNRILSNLISNAITHADTGTIVVSAKEHADKLRISVKDNGRGIPEDKQQHIFEEFSQLQNPERDRTKGLGLGLAICSRLVKILDSRILLQSSPGKGAIFYFDLTLSENHFSKNTIEHSQHSNLDFSNLRILILDDEQEIREAMEMYLTDSGCKSIITAGSTNEAIKNISIRGIPDLVISDYRLRKHKKGIDAIHDIRSEFGQNIKAIIVTGDTSPKSLAAFKASGITTLHKPVNPTRLTSTINSLFSKK